MASDSTTDDNSLDEIDVFISKFEKEKEKILMNIQNIEKKKDILYRKHEEDQNILNEELKEQDTKLESLKTQFDNGIARLKAASGERAQTGSESSEETARSDEESPEEMLKRRNREEWASRISPRMMKGEALTRAVKTLGLKNSQIRKLTGFGVTLVGKLLRGDTKKFEDDTNQIFTNMYLKIQEKRATPTPQADPS